MKELELFPTRKEKSITPDWESEQERVHWIIFVMGFFVGCIATVGLILL